MLNIPRFVNMKRPPVVNQWPDLRSPYRVDAEEGYCDLICPKAKLSKATPAFDGAAATITDTSVIHINLLMAIAGETDVRLTLEGAHRSASPYFACRSGRYPESISPIQKLASC